MAISDKLNYLIETKSQLKDMINYGLPTENQITNETTFRNYVKGIFEAFIESLRDSTTLYTNLPKISGNGTQITLNDTANAPMRITLKASELTQDGTPTPDSPQDIHTISGDNSVVVEGKNILSLKYVGNAGWNLYYENPMKSVGTYTLSCQEQIVFGENVQGFAMTFQNTINGSDIDTYFVGYNFGRELLEATKTITQNQANAKYICLKPNGNGLTTDIIRNAQTMLEKGSTATEYEEYKEQTTPLNLPIDNLLNQATVQDGYVNGDGTINTGHTREEGYSEFIKVSPNTKYKFQIFESSWVDFGSQNWIGVGEYSTNNVSGFIRRDTNYAVTENSLSFTTTSNTQYIVVSARGLASATKAQVNEGDLTSYTPYGTTPIEYCKIGNYEDEFIYNTTDTNLELNKWYLKKNIGKVVLDGSESWGLDGSGKIAGIKVTDLLYENDTSQVGKGFSNRHIIGNLAAARNNSNSFSTYYNGTNNLWLNAQGLSLADFKTWLSTHNTIVYYVLSTPTYTQITGTLETQLNNIYKNMLSYKGTTNVSQINNDLPFVLGVSAIQDLE